jgi:hypothetical protein
VDDSQADGRDVSACAKRIILNHDPCRLYSNVDSGDGTGFSKRVDGERQGCCTWPLLSESDRWSVATVPISLFRAVAHGEILAQHELRCDLCTFEEKCWNTVVFVGKSSKGCGLQSGRGPGLGTNPTSHPRRRPVRTQPLPPDRWMRTYTSTHV